MEKIVEQGMLYDFYGALLTKHQQAIYEAAVFNDLSLSELAEDFNISRQGVHDLLKRCDKTMREYEEKLQLVEKFIKIRENTAAIMELAKDTNISSQIQGLCNLILEEI